ncbi:MAG TPA: hypothetical protein P5140_08055 [Methanofastidiosum sp.]|nr:hypothetical protein [Methanofastidiosum sp.]
MKEKEKEFIKKIQQSKSIDELKDLVDNFVHTGAVENEEKIDALLGILDQVQVLRNAIIYLQNYSIDNVRLLSKVQELVDEVNELLDETRVTGGE